MAIARMSVSIVSRSKGQSAIASSAYFNRCSLERTDGTITKDYSKGRPDMIYNEVMLPPNAPQEYHDRQKLWQSVENCEQGNRAQLARKVLISLPKELSVNEQIELTKDIVNSSFVSRGMCADFAIHWSPQKLENPHVHVMLTMRSIDDKGEWKAKKTNEYVLDNFGHKVPEIDKKTGLQKRQKNGAKIWKRETKDVNDWNQKDTLEKWRHEAEIKINERLKSHGIEPVDFRSYEKQQAELEKEQKELLSASQNAEKKLKQAEVGLKRFENDVKRETKIREGYLDREQNLTSKLTFGVFGGISDREIAEKQRYAKYVREGNSLVASMNDWQREQLGAKLEFSKCKDTDRKHLLLQVMHSPTREAFEQELQQEREKKLAEQRERELAAAREAEIREQRRMEHAAELQKEIAETIEKIDKAKKEHNLKALEEARSGLYSCVNFGNEYNLLTSEQKKTLQERVKQEKDEAKQKPTGVLMNDTERALNTRARSAEMMKFKGRDKGRDRGGWSR